MAFWGSSGGQKMVEMRTFSTFLFFTPEVETDQMKVQIGRKTRLLGFYGLKNRILKFRPLLPADSAGRILVTWGFWGVAARAQGRSNLLNIHFF